MTLYGPGGEIISSPEQGAPDGSPFSLSNYPYQWGQADREKGWTRHHEGGRSFETSVAVTNSDGTAINQGTARVFEEIRDILAEGATDLPETQDVRVLNQPVVPGLFVTEQVRIPYGATSGALDANDCYGEIARVLAPIRGRILSIKRIDQDDVVTADTIHVFSARFVAAASDAAFTISAVDGANWITTQVFPTGTDLGSVRVSEIADVDSEYQLPQVTEWNGVPLGYLYFQESTTGTATPTAGGMPLVQFYILPLI